LTCGASTGDGTQSSSDRKASDLSPRATKRWHAINEENKLMKIRMQHQRELYEASLQLAKLDGYVENESQSFYKLYAEVKSDMRAMRTKLQEVTNHVSSLEDENEQQCSELKASRFRNKVLSQAVDETLKTMGKMMEILEPRVELMKRIGIIRAVGQSRNSKQDLEMFKMLRKTMEIVVVASESSKREDDAETAYGNEESTLASNPKEKKKGIDASRHKSSQQKGVDNGKKEVSKTDDVHDAHAEFKEHLSALEGFSDELRDDDLDS